MASRYQEVFRLQPKLYLEGSPVIIEAGALQHDSAMDKVLAQIKIKNINPKIIIACKVVIRAFEVNGTELEGVSSFQYLDINIPQGECFGSKTPIYLPNNTTRQINVAVTEIVYSDNSIWESGPKEWNPIQQQLALMDHFHDLGLVKQYQLEVGKDSKFVPMVSEGLFRCTCGNENLQEPGICFKCHRNYNDIVSKLEVSYIQEKIEERLQKEEEKRQAELAARREAERQEAERRRLEEEKAEQERARQKVLQAEKTKKTIIIFSIMAAIVLLFVAIFYLVPLYRYNMAGNDFSNQNFDSAYNTYVALGDFKDSSQKSIETIYAKAQYLESQQLYEEAKEEYQKIEFFQDSSLKALNCGYEAVLKSAIEKYNTGEYRDALNLVVSIEQYSGVADWKEKIEYSYAKQSFDNGEYEEAYDTFRSLASLNYEDSSEWVIESCYMRGIAALDSEEYNTAYECFGEVEDYKDSLEKKVQALYLYSNELMDQKMYKEACDNFGSSILKGYEDSETKYKQAAYLYASASYSIANYSEAISYYWKASGYEDADTMLIDSRYEKAMVDIANEDYKSAADGLALIKDYKDSNTKLKEVKYAYVQGHMDSNNATTYNYLNDLKSVGYLDSKNLFSDLFDFRLVCFAINNSENNETTYSTSLSKYDKWYFHFRIEGGPPTQTGEKFYYKITYPNGSSSKKDELGSWCVGQNWWINCWWDPPSSCPRGKLTLTVYDSKSKVIGTASVNIN